MSPTRAGKSTKAGDGTNNKQKTYHKKSNPEEPGVQKLKASLRQARRLLAKENLASDVQVQTERRVKSLEADLARAETRRKERSMAVRYHKVKFFDKQKVTRKINQTKRALQAPELDKKARKKLQKELLNHRVDLNYIIHYPKLVKYVSLYPSSTSGDANATETDRLREERRAATRQAMDMGEIEAEPEMRQKAGDADDDKEIEDEGDLDESGTESPPFKSRHVAKSQPKPKPTDTKKSQPSTKPVSTQQLVDVREDDFFDT